MDPNGHAAIVTGGGSGLGAATAARLAADGARVAVIDMNADAAHEVAKPRSTASDDGGMPVWVHCAPLMSCVFSMAEKNITTRSRKDTVATGAGPRLRKQTPFRA